MSEQLEQALTESTTKIITWMEQAEGFVVEQAPDVVQQLLAWRMAEASLGVTGCLLAGLACLFATRWGWSRLEDDEIEPAGFFGCLLGSFGMFISIVGLYINGLMLAKVLVAPKLVVLDALRGLL